MVNSLRVEVVQLTVALCRKVQDLNITDSPNGTSEITCKVQFAKGDGSYEVYEETDHKTFRCDGNLTQ